MGASSSSRSFSVRFLALASLSPVVGRPVDRQGPRLVVGTGVYLLAAGLCHHPLQPRLDKSTPP